MQSIPSLVPPLNTHLDAGLCRTYTLITHTTHTSTLSLMSYLHTHLDAGLGAVRHGQEGIILRVPDVGINAIADAVQFGQVGCNGPLATDLWELTFNNREHSGSQHLTTGNRH